MGSIESTWRELDVAIIGGGIGGLTAATSLQTGYRVIIHERAELVGEVGTPISCTANVTKGLEEQGVNIPFRGRVVLQTLIRCKRATNNVRDYILKYSYGLRKT